MRSLSEAGSECFTSGEDVSEGPREQGEGAESVQTADCPAENRFDDIMKENAGLHDQGRQSDSDDSEHD